MEQKQPLSSGFNSVTKYKYNLLDVIVVINYPLIGDHFGVRAYWLKFGKHSGSNANDGINLDIDMACLLYIE